MDFGRRLFISSSPKVFSPKMRSMSIGPFLPCPFPLTTYLVAATTL
jgi:hypothetical protein